MLKYNTSAVSFNTLSVIACRQVAPGGGTEKMRFRSIGMVTGRLLLTGPGKRRLLPSTTA